MYNRISITLFLSILLINNNLFSQWSTDPTVNNPISTDISEQATPAITFDGSNGAIIVWEDWRNGGNDNHDIYAQKINSNGLIQWTLDGIPICTEASSISNPTIISDGNGGAYIAWVDFRNNATTNYDIYAQRINSSGTVLWATDGIVVCEDASSQYNPAIASDGNGGAIITWWDLRNGVFNADIYAQRLDANGAVQWATDGIAICTEATEQRYPSIINNGTSGAIISWQDYTTNDIYAQRIDANGTSLWTPAGVAVCTQSNAQFNPVMAFDAFGGAIISWWDNRNGNWDIYAQRINSSGSPLWTSDGVAVCSQVSDQQSPTMTSDGGGGAIVTWVDARNGSGGGYSDIYAQRINSVGITQWVNDVEISTNFAAQYLPVITSPGSGRAVIAWYDYRNNNNDIYATQLYPDGTLPVELTALTLTKGIDQSIIMRWTTAMEVNNYGFEVERNELIHRSIGSLNQSADESMNQWSKVGFVEGNGTTNAPKEYSYTDYTTTSGTYSYRLKQIDRDGKFEYSQSVEVTIGAAPNVFLLEQNYPNPFNPSSTIGFTLKESGMTTLKIYDAIGREVATLVNEYLEAGILHQRLFSAKGESASGGDESTLPSGIYFARLSSSGISIMKKMILMK